MKTKTKVLVVEDEMIVAYNVCDALEELGYEVLEPCINYTEALTRIKENLPDIGILDINLSGKKTGIDLAKKIKEDYNFPIIFLTANADKSTVKKAKAVMPDAYLLKPFTSNELYTSIEIALYNFEQKNRVLNQSDSSKNDSLFIKTKGKIIKLDFDDITYIESSHVYVEINLVDGKKHVVRSSLKEILEKLNPQFVRVQRGYIVNIKHIKKVESKEIIVADKEIPISENYKKALFEKLDFL